MTCLTVVIASAAKQSRAGLTRCVDPSDIENGRPTEGEHVIGDLARRADRRGVDAPILPAALGGLQVY
jgi:hypothetical protein